MDKSEPETLRRWPLALLLALLDRVRAGAAGAVGSASLGLGLGFWFWFWSGFEFGFGLLGAVVVVIDNAAGLASWPPSSIGAVPRARTGLTLWGVLKRGAFNRSVPGGGVGWVIRICFTRLGVVSRWWVP